MNASPALRWIPLLVALAPAPVFAHDDKPNPYNGRERTEKAELRNGARVNARLARHPFLEEDPKLTEVAPRVWTISGYALSNCSFVETDKGVVIFDTGSNVGQGRYFLSQIRKVTDKPVIAIIYSHTHYTGGASAIADGRAVPIYAHAKLTANLRTRTLELAPSHIRRANMQFGGYLPRSGEDAAASTPEPAFVDPALRRAGSLPVTRPVADGEEVEIGGTRFVFKWATADTDDSLTVWLPDRKTVLTNNVTNMFFPLYTLRGEAYRNPLAIIRSLDDVRSLGAETYVPVHGDPVRGREAIERQLTLHRDAYSFTYNQAVRGINLGWSPDQIVQRTTLPRRLRDEPTLYQAYSEFDFGLRGVYRGLVGWFAEDAAELNPPSAGRLGQSIVTGFGGMHPLLEAAREAQARREYDLAAKLAGYGVDAQPTSSEARQAKADALRAMAQAASGLQAHNFYLTEALALEGKIDRQGLPPHGTLANTPPEVLAQAPAIDLVRVLESRIDPVASGGVFRSIILRFDEEPSGYLLMIRDGIAEIRAAGVPQVSGAPEVNVGKLDWAAYLQGRVTAGELAASGKLTGVGIEPTEAAHILGWFELPPMVTK